MTTFTHDRDPQDHQSRRWADLRRKTARDRRRHRSCARRGAAAQLAWAACRSPRAARCSGGPSTPLSPRRMTLPLEITWQMGRPIRHAPGEVRGFEERARYMLALAPEALAAMRPGEKAGFRAPHQARAARSRRRGGAVELSLPDGGQCRAAGADCRQHRDPQAFAPDAAVRRALPRSLRERRRSRPVYSNTFICRTPIPLV